MNWFYNLKTSIKLILCFIVVACMAGIVGIIAITNINNLEENDVLLYKTVTIPLSDISEMNTIYQMVRSYVRDMILEDDQKKIENISDIVQKNLAEMSNIMDNFKSSINTDEAISLYEEFNTAFINYKRSIETLRYFCLENDDQNAYRYVESQMDDVANQLRNILTQLLYMKLQSGEEQYQQNVTTASIATVTMVATIIVAVMLAVSLGIFVSRSFSKPLDKLLIVANQIADGNLDVSANIDTNDEIGILAQAFDKMADRLNDLVSNINVAAEQVAAGSSQLYESSFTLSQGASEQASTIEELTASLEEISAQTRQNAENSDQANSLAGMAKDTAQQGNRQMQDMMNAMEEIQKSSRNINKIIKVIDDIAFQTNILALNAAVEAARAGQHGRGFAVVADEVRKLASRSANAAKETSEMIEASISNIERGTQIAQRTADALDKIVEDVGKVASLMENIAIASKEQASGIAQVNEGITIVSEVVQKNSATAEESASASEELSGQAQNLKEHIKLFKLKKSDSEKNALSTTATTIPKPEKSDIKTHEYKADVNAHVNDQEKENETPCEIDLSDSEFDKY